MSKSKPRFTPVNINATTLNELADEVAALQAEVASLRSALSTVAASKQKEKEPAKQES